MMSFEASAAHQRFSETLSSATRGSDRVVRALADDALRAYGDALDEQRTSESSWRAFFARVASLADALERESQPPRAALAELRALLCENVDLLAHDLVAARG
jgi:hypothetical protein